MFDESGYLATRPIGQHEWRKLCPELPGGVVISNESVPPGFLIVQNYINPGICDALVAECERQAGAPHTVAEAGATDAPVKSAARSSECVDVRTLGTDVIALVRRTYGNVVAPHFRVEIDWFELPEILRYRSGGEYKPHADAHHWEAEAKEWRKIVDRDLSILVYLNEGFEGGEIDFPNFGMKLAPKRGMLIAFPSDPRYVHAARPVTSGVRYALVSWATVRGTPRISDSPRPLAIQM